MDTTKRLYVDFEPSYQIVQGKNEDTIILVVPGFSNEQLRVEVGDDGNLKARGERPLDGIRWSRFTKDFRLPLMNYDVRSIQADFEDDTLYVTLPKIFRAEPEKSNAPPPKPQPRPTLPLPPPPPPPPPPAVEHKKPGPPLLTPEPPREKQAEEEEKQQQQRATTTLTHKERMQEKEREGGLTNGLETPRRRTLLLNMAVAVAVLFGMGIYVIFKLTKPSSSNERSK